MCFTGDKPNKPLIFLFSGSAHHQRWSFAFHFWRMHLTMLSLLWYKQVQYDIYTSHQARKIIHRPDWSFYSILPQELSIGGYRKKHILKVWCKSPVLTWLGGCLKNEGCVKFFFSSRLVRVLFHRGSHTPSGLRWTPLRPWSLYKSNERWLLNMHLNYLKDQICANMFMHLSPFWYPAQSTAAPWHYLVRTHYFQHL